MESVLRRDIQSLYDFHKYQRKFACIGGWLHQKKTITNQEYWRYFWKGIPRLTQKKLEDCMLQVDPKLLHSEPFQLDIIIVAADNVSNISWFYDEDSSDSDRTDSDDEDDSSTSSEETDSEESASNDEHIKKLKQASSKVKSKVKAQKLKVKPKSWDESINHPLPWCPSPHLRRILTKLPISLTNWIDSISMTQLMEHSIVKLSWKHPTLPPFLWSPPNVHLSVSLKPTHLPQIQTKCLIIAHMNVSFVENKVWTLMMPTGWCNGQSRNNLSKQWKKNNLVWWNDNPMKWIRNHSFGNQSGTCIQK